MFVPKLTEEEARFLALRFLSQSPKRQGSIEEIRASIRACREMGKDDLRPNPTRSNAPFWHQIVQNATDRFIGDHGYVITVMPPPNKVIRLTEQGLEALRPHIDYFVRHPNVETFLFFDDTILDDLYIRNRAKLKAFTNARKMADFVKSRSSASATNATLEANGFAGIVLDGLEKKYAAVATEEGAFRLRQIRNWRDTRGDFDPMAAVTAALDKMAGKLGS